MKIIIHFSHNYECLFTANDLRSLIDSNEFQRAMQSTGRLVSTTADKLVKIALLTITIPAKITASVVGQALHVTSNMILIIRPYETSCRRISQEAFQSTRSESNNLQPHEVIIRTAIVFLPVAKNAVDSIVDRVGSTILNLVAWQNPGESSSEHSPDEPIIHHCCTFVNVDLSPVVLDGIEDSERNEVPSCLRQVASEEPVATRQVSTRQVSTIALQKPIRESFYFSLRVCDLQILSKANGCDKMLKHLELHYCGHNENLGDVIQNMVIQALHLAENDRFELTNNIQNQANRSSPKGTSDGNRDSEYSIQTKTSPILWKEEGATAKHLKKLISKHCNVDKRIQILETEIFLWSGRIQSKHINSYSHKIPLFKARGIILHMTPKDLVDLFMDNSKVQLYNKFSNGRKDVCIFENNEDGIVTKIVENEAQIPFSGKIIKVLTLLHSRPLDMDGKHDEFIVVSRSVEMSSEPVNNMPVNNNKNEASPGDKNEVIWGVNILRKVPGNQQMVDLTTMTQANTCAVPGFMAHKLGVMCANDFIKNVRNIQL